MDVNVELSLCEQASPTKGGYRCAPWAGPGIDIRGRESPDYWALQETGAVMKSFDRMYLIWALCYAVAGMALGIYMGVSHNHGQFVSHAHIMLVGFVTSLIYAVIHRLWLPAPSRALATIQFILHQAGSLAMFTGLLLLYGRATSEDQIGPLMGSATLAVVLGVLLMLVMVLKAEVRPAQSVDAVEGRRTATS